MKTIFEFIGIPITFSRSRINLLLMLIIGLAFPCAGADPVQEKPRIEGATPLIKVDDTLSALPGVRIRNLEVFALVGPDQITRRDYLTLSEAMDKQLVRVKETHNVSELTIENTSTDRHVFIQAGDIVKGGRQDRCLSTDLVLPPRSGAQPIGSFCVEQGRWSRRAAESDAAFSGNDKLLITTAQRYAVKSAKQQSAVWNEVDKSKKALTANSEMAVGAKVNVEANTSPSSLQLALENKQLADAIRKMRDDLTKAFLQRGDVIGVAYSINGKLVNAEIYGNARLFSKLRSKVLEAAATEAITELRDKNVSPPATTGEDLRKFLQTDGLSKSKVSKPNPQTECREREESNRALYESRDADFRDAACHRNVILADDAVKNSVRGQRGINSSSSRQQQEIENPAPVQSSPR